MSTTSQSPTPSPTGSFSSIFQSPGGPPLILVCIAAGLLLGAFIGVLLMRRMRPPVVVQRMNSAAAFFGGLNPYLGEKPKLLDIHLLPEEGVGAGADGRARLGGELGAWGRVSPFAAVCLPSPNGESSPAPSPLSPSPSATPSQSRRLFTRILARLPRANRRYNRSHELSTLSATQPEVKQVQLAVTISMPSPQHPSYLSLPPTTRRTGSGGTHGNHEEENPMPDCCIGTVVVSYRPSPNDASAPSSASSAVAAAMT